MFSGHGSHSFTLLLGAVEAVQVLERQIDTPALRVLGDVAQDVLVQPIEARVSALRQVHLDAADEIEKVLPFQRVLRLSSAAARNTTFAVGFSDDI